MGTGADSDDSVEKPFDPSAFPGNRQDRRSHGPARDDWLEGWEDEPNLAFDPSPLDPFAAQRRLGELMSTVRLARDVRRSLFTFGDTALPYLLVQPGEDGRATLAQGSVTVARPTILTPSSEPEFFGFFEELAEAAGADLADFVQFALQRTAAFHRLKVNNEFGLSQQPGGDVAEVVDRANRRLDDEEDEDTAILVAPRGLGPLAVLKYAATRISRSGPDNIQELRERGFLPE